MIWFFAEDDFYYKKEEIDKLKKNYSLDKIISFPDKDTVLKSLNSSAFEKIAFIAPYYPEKIHNAFDNKNFFNIIKLNNIYAPFTSTQIKLGLDKNKILEDNLGVKISRSNLSLKDYIGAEKLVEIAKELETQMLLGLNPKGLFLVGLPGTGKSFFTKCFAGETGRILIELNFTKIMESPYPIDTLYHLIYYIQNNPGKYLIRMDEIEKMLSNLRSQEVLGTFLTLINDFNTTVSNALFMATANNIADLSSKNPELFRSGGRFDEIIALMPPTEENAFKIFMYYFKKLLDIYQNDNFITVLLSLMYPELVTFQESNIKKLANEFFNKIKNKNYFMSLRKKIFDYIEYIKNPNGNFFDEEFARKIQIASNNDEKFLLLKKKFIQFYFEYLDNYIEFETMYNEFIKNSFFQNFEDFIEKNIIHNINIKYRELAVIRNRFPYTQSEISTFANKLYTKYFFTNNSFDYSLRQTINNTSPLQIKMASAIAKMESEIKTFIQI